MAFLEGKFLEGWKDSPSLLSLPLLFCQIGTCEVKNAFPKPNITWYRNNTPLQASRDGERTPASPLGSLSFSAPFPFMPLAETRISPPPPSSKSEHSSQIHHRIQWPVLRHK